MSQTNTKALTALGFNLAQPDTAATTADEMAGLPASANGDKAEQNESNILRDKACTYMKEPVDEVGNQENND